VGIQWQTGTKYPSNTFTKLFPHPPKNFTSAAVTLKKLLPPGGKHITFSSARARITKSAFFLLPQQNNSHPPQPQANNTQRGISHTSPFILSKTPHFQQSYTCFSHSFILCIQIAQLFLYVFAPLQHG
jgi:hypothetical protein